MDEWQVVGVVAALVALIVSIGAPILKLNGSIVRLTVTLEGTGRDISEVRSDLDGLVKSHKADVDALAARGSEGRRRLWQHNGAQDQKLQNHELRLCRLEKEEEL